jgi:hypothetical protein
MERERPLLAHHHSLSFALCVPDTFAANLLKGKRKAWETQAFDDYEFN